MARMIKDYETYQFFQLIEETLPHEEEYTVIVEDMGEDCTYI